MLNKRSEIAKRCRHREKCMLAGYSGKHVPQTELHEDEEMISEDEDEGGGATGTQETAEEWVEGGAEGNLSQVEGEGEQRRVTRSMARKRLGNLSN